MDLASLASVDACVAAVLQQRRRIDYLIANAGVAYSPQQKTADGFEMQIGGCLIWCSLASCCIAARIGMQFWPSKSCL